MFPHFMFFPEGDVLEPDGYSPSASAVVTTLLIGQSPEFADRKLRLIDIFMNRPVEKGENPRSVLTEGFDARVTRVIRFLRFKGYGVVPSRKPNCADEFEILVPEGRSPDHARQIISILRQFYQLLGAYNVGNSTAANPLELPGWHLKSEEERRDSWCARYPDRKYAWMYAGLRFRPSTSKAYLPLIEDPTGCGQAMTKAVIAYGCPKNVIAICIVMQENGCRWREAAWLNALGWAKYGFSERVFTTNKTDPREHAKTLLLHPDVLSDLIRRFEETPHPHDPAKTMMDYLRERAAARDYNALRAIPLFPNSRGKKYKHRTFNGYWFRPAMEAWVNEDGTKGLLIFSDVGSRRPTPHWYRHASISHALEQKVAGLETLKEVLDVSKAVCATFDLKTDQAERYAAALMRRISAEQQMRRVLQNRIELADARAEVDIPAAIPALKVSAAERLFAQLPQRQREDA